MKEILEDIRADRAAQVLKWGGSKHDDKHAAEEWLRFIGEKLEKAEALIGNPKDLPEPDAIYRRRLIQIAALAVAAVESLDRHHARP